MNPTETFATSLVALAPRYPMEDALEFAALVRDGAVTTRYAGARSIQAAAAKPAGKPITCPQCAYEAPVAPGAKDLVLCPSCGATFSQTGKVTLPPMAASANYADKVRLNRLVRGMQSVEPGLTYASALSRLTQKTAGAR